MIYKSETISETIAIIMFHGNLLYEVYVTFHIMFIIISVFLRYVRYVTNSIHFQSFEVVYLKL